MANLFFSFSGEIQDAAQIVFQALGFSCPTQRNSFNVLDGIYYSVSALGFKIKLEANSYGYEDEYNYMLSVNEDYLVALELDDTIAESLAHIIAKLLRKNSFLKIAQEKGNQLIVI